MFFNVRMFHLLSYMVALALVASYSVNVARADPVLGYVVVKDPAKQDLAVNTNPNVKLQLIGDRLYYFGSVLQGNWFQALQFCNYHEMQLLSIESKEENDAVFRKLSTYLMGGAGGEYRFWSSGTTLQNGFYTWTSTGNPILYASWAPNQPSDPDGNKRCIEVIRPADGTTLLWSHSDCYLPRYVICETGIPKCASQWIRNHVNCSCTLTDTCH